jgi:hypothetical protein
MTKPTRRSPWILIVALGIIGSCAAALALSLVGNGVAVPYSGLIIGFAMVLCFVCFTWILLRYIGWRDQLRAQSGGRPASTMANSRIDPKLEGTIHGLVPDVVYQVQQSFTDYYGNQFQQSERLRFRERHFLPYHGGHTIVFVERSLYLQETENAVILANFSQYIARVTS